MAFCLLLYRIMSVVHSIRGCLIEIKVDKQKNQSKSALIGVPLNIFVTETISCLLQAIKKYQFSALNKISQGLLITALTLLAFGLRAYRLDFQSYWIDEALTIFYANLSLDELWYNLQTVRAVPPIYHLLILYWVQLAGDGEYALRFFSLVFSVLAIPLTYRLGHALGDRGVGFCAAFLMAIAPYQVWHAQDARNYSMLTAASIVSMWGFLNMWRRSGRRWWVLYIIGTEWTLMTHYHGLIIIGIQGLFFLLTWRRHWRHYLAWGGALSVVFLPYLAWLIYGSRLWQGVHWLPKVGLWESYLQGALAYSVGELIPRPEGIPLTVIFLIFYALGLLYAIRRRWTPWRGSEMMTLLLIYTLAPNMATWLFSELRTPVYLERYLIPVQVGYLLTIAMGVLALADGVTRMASMCARRSTDRITPTRGASHVSASSNALFVFSMAVISGRTDTMYWLNGAIGSA